MGLHGNTIHVRLTPELLQKFDALHGEYAGLPASMVVKILLANQLRKPLSVQVEIIQMEIKGGAPLVQQRTARLRGSNTPRNVNS